MRMEWTFLFFGRLVHWSIGPLVHWSIGSLQMQKLYFLYKDYTFFFENTLLAGVKKHFLPDRHAKRGNANSALPEWDLVLVM